MAYHQLLFAPIPYSPLSQPSIHAAPYGNADAVEAKPLSHSKLHECLGLPVIPNNPITH